MPTKENAAPVKADERQTLTNWRAFEVANLIPLQITCQGYKPAHRVDLSCHSNLHFSAKQMLSHLNSDHGGGFQIFLRKGDRPWKGWREFEDLKIESADFRCELCEKVLPFHPNHLLTHLKPHAGKVKKIKPGGVYNLTIAINIVPLEPEEEAFAELG